MVTVEVQALTGVSQTMAMQFSVSPNQGIVKVWLAGEDSMPLSVEITRNDWELMSWVISKQLRRGEDDDGGF